MASQLSVRARNARLDSIETVMAASPTIRIRAGAPPANTAAARSGAILSTIVAPADFMGAAANGSKAIAGGPWTDVDGADNTGVAGHFEIEGTGGTIDMQGTVGVTGSGADMEVSNVNFQAGQPFQITGFTLNEPNG
jgi:hypothetical protein